MPSVFDTQFAAIAFPGLLNQFGESITYWPFGRASRTITAIVNRDPPSVFDASGNAVFPTATIQMLNSATKGISSHEVDVGADEIEMFVKIGDTVSKRVTFMSLLSQSGGVTQLAVV